MDVTKYRSPQDYQPPVPKPILSPIRESVAFLALQHAALGPKGDMQLAKGEKRVGGTTALPHPAPPCALFGGRGIVAMLHLHKIGFYSIYRLPIPFGPRPQPSAPRALPGSYPAYPPSQPGSPRWPRCFAFTAGARLSRQASGCQGLLLPDVAPSRYCPRYHGPLWHPLGAARQRPRVSRLGTPLGGIPPGKGIASAAFPPCARALARP
jgi:hypothetical protein